MEDLSVVHEDDTESVADSSMMDDTMDLGTEQDMSFDGAGDYPTANSASNEMYQSSRVVNSLNHDTYKTF